MSYVNKKFKLHLLIWHVQVLNQNDQIVFYKIVFNELSIPEVIEYIRVNESLHVKLFYKGCSVPLPQWFRSGHNCTIAHKSIFENFPPYIFKKSSRKTFLGFQRT